MHMPDPSVPTLAQVVRHLPDECYDNPTWRGLLYFFRDLLIYGGTVWGLLSADSPWLLIPLWLLAGLAISALFVVGHDAAHGALFRKSWLNHWVGQIAMLPSLHLYEAWVFGHNRIHHGHTTRQEMDYVWHPLTPQEFAALPAWRKLVHRLEWSCLGAGVAELHVELEVVRASAEFKSAIIGSISFSEPEAIRIRWRGSSISSRSSSLS